MFFLTGDDVRALKRMISEWRRYTGETFGEDGSHPFPSSAVYIAKVPEGGIAAIDTTGTGTGAGAPGSAVCNIYRINTTSGLLEKLPDFADTLVWNISTTALEPGYVLVSKTKNGAWVASSAAGGIGGSVGWIDFELNEELTTADATAQGTIIVQYGDEEGGTGTGGTVTLINPMAQAFFGSIGARGQGLKVAASSYVIVQLEQDCEGGTGTGTA